MLDLTFNLVTLDKILRKFNRTQQQIALPRQRKLRIVLYLQIHLLIYLDLIQLGIHQELIQLALHQDQIQPVLDLDLKSVVLVMCHKIKLL